MDRIIVADLAVSYHVGVPDEERLNPQRLLVTIELTADFSEAARSDDLSKTIDYAALVARVERFGERRTWRLIETLAVELAEMVLRDFGAASVAVEVKKFILPQTRYIAVRTERPASPRAPAGYDR